MRTSPFKKNYCNQIGQDRPHLVKQSTPRRRSNTKTSRSPSSIQKPLSQPKKIYKNGIQLKFTSKEPINTSYYFFSNEGYLLIYKKHLKSNIIHGKSILIFPDGIIFILYFNEGSLYKGCGFKKDVFVLVNRFANGRVQGRQFSYDVQREVVTESCYRFGKLQEIVTSKVRSMDQFNKIIGSCQQKFQIPAGLNLHQTLSQFCLPIHQTPQYTYYGQLSQKIPHGFGLIYTQNDLFYGQFQNGLLCSIGVILFQNNDYFYGEFQNGSMVGYGKYKNEGKIVYKKWYEEIERDKFQEWRDQFFGGSGRWDDGVVAPILQLHGKLEVIYILRVNKIVKEVSKIDVVVSEDSLENVESSEFEKSGQLMINTAEKQQSRSYQQQSNRTDKKQVQKFMKLLEVQQNHTRRKSKDKIRESRANRKKKVRKQVIDPQQKSIKQASWIDTIKQLSEDSVNIEQGYYQPLNPKKQLSFNPPFQQKLIKNNVGQFLDNRLLMTNQSKKEMDSKVLGERMVGKIVNMRVQ